MLYKNIHSNFVYNSQQLETTQMSIKEKWIKKWWYIHVMEKNF